MRTRIAFFTLFSLAGILLVPIVLAVSAESPGGDSVFAPAVAMAQPLLTGHARGVISPDIPVIPETGMLVLVGTTLIGLAAAMRRTRH